MKQIRDEKGITKFEHDAWSNLAKTIFPNGEEQLRNPDAVGNLYKTIDRKDRVYAKGGQLKKANGWHYEYDAEGNLIRKSENSSPFGGGREGAVWKYEWNDAGMLTKVTRPDKTAVTFTYDALGRRLSKQYKNTITKFVWDGNVPLHEWKEHAITKQKLGDLSVNGDGSISSPTGGGQEGAGITTWLFDTDSFAPAGKIKNSKQYSIVTDHLGTPSQMYKEDGALFWECELDSYGKPRMEKGEFGSCPFRYQGQYEDAETGLYYNRFRYYAVEEGMYVSKDPIGLESGDPSFYTYVIDPNNWLDSFGLANYSGKKKVPNPYGKKGGPAHQKKVAAIAADIKKRGLKPEFEHKVVTTGGHKDTRYVDVVARDPKTGKIVEYHQVGKQRITDGQPISREAKAINDLEGPGGIGKNQVQFTPYN